VLEITPLLLMMKTLAEQTKDADRKLAQMVKEDAAVNRLCSVPEVRPVTAVTYVATLDEVSRFGDAKQVRAYLDLSTEGGQLRRVVPSRKDHQGGQQLSAVGAGRSCMGAATDEEAGDRGTQEVGA
jgi:transposase